MRFEVLSDPATRRRTMYLHSPDGVLAIQLRGKWKNEEAARAELLRAWREREGRKYRAWSDALIAQRAAVFVLAVEKVRRQRG